MLLLFHKPAMYFAAKQNATFISTHCSFQILGLESYIFCTFPYIQSTVGELELVNVSKEHCESHGLYSNCSTVTIAPPPPGHGIICVYNINSLLVSSPK